VGLQPTTFLSVLFPSISLLSRWHKGGEKLPSLVISVYICANVCNVNDINLYVNIRGAEGIQKLSM